MTQSTKTDQNITIPHIFHVIPSFAHGGVPIRISNLMNHFGPRVRHSILSTDDIYTCQSRLNDNVNFSIPDIGNADKGNIFSRLWHYRIILKSLKPDLLLTYNWGSTEWALAHSFSPICRHYHLESGFGPEEAHATLPKRNYFRRLALRNVNGIIVPSQTLVKICRTDWAISDHKINYFPNGVDCEKYALPPLENIVPGFVKGDNEIIIGTMTPLRPEKNLPRLITAFNELVRTTSNSKTNTEKKFKLIIMGEGNERQKLEQLISSYGLSDEIYLPGHIDDPARALGWLDIYAISSDTEQMPNSLNQAMAASLPIVGLDVGDVKFMMPEQNKAFITPAGDDIAFAEALKSLATNNILRKDLSRINKAHVKENFDQQRMFDAYAKVWGVDN